MPLQVESGSKQGKWLLYLTDAIELSPAGVGECFINPRNINFLGLRYRQRQSELVTKTSAPLPPVMVTDQSSQSQYKYEEPRYNSILGRTCAAYNSWPGHVSFAAKLSCEILIIFPVICFISNCAKLFHLAGESNEKDDEFFLSSSSSYKHSVLTKTQSVKTSHRKIENSYNSYHETVNKRHKRNVETVIEADSVVTEDGSVSRVVVFDCGRKSAKCFTISCNLPRLKRRDFAVIKLRSRVWNSTLVEDYPHIDSVVINARARLEMAPDLASQQMRGDDETTVSVVAFPDGLSETGMANIPVWVMVVSIMTGLLVVVIISLILWKFGFFERKRVTDVAHNVKISKQLQSQTYHQYPPLMNGNEYIS